MILHQAQRSVDSFGTQVCGRYNGIPESEQNRVALWEQVLAGEYPGNQQVSEVSLGGCPWAVTGRIVLERKMGTVGRLSHLPGASACVSYGLCLQDRTKARQHLVLPGLFISTAISIAAPFLALGSQRNLFETFEILVPPSTSENPLCFPSHTGSDIHLGQAGGPA